jgi:hypothetical protein
MLRGVSCFDKTLHGEYVLVDRSPSQWLHPARYQHSIWTKPIKRSTKEDREHRAYFPISKGPLVTSPVYFRNTTSTQYRNHSKKCCPDAAPPMTDNSQLRYQQFAQSPVPVVRYILAKQVITSAPVLQNISEASGRETVINSRWTFYSNQTQHWFWQNGNQCPQLKFHIIRKASEVTKCPCNLTCEDGYILSKVWLHRLSSKPLTQPPLSMNSD